MNVDKSHICCHFERRSRHKHGKAWLVNDDLCFSPGNQWKNDKACACHRARQDMARLVLVTGQSLEKMTRHGMAWRVHGMFLSPGNRWKNDKA
jgi:hypothetical protein